MASCCKGSSGQKIGKPMTKERTFSSKTNKDRSKEGKIIRKGNK
jgi:hypothetical protein